MIKTDRLLLRQWKATDQTAFIALNQDQRVMEKLGMSAQDKTFLHPKVSKSSGLQEHVLYQITRNVFVE